ncbi:golgin subfamily A member 5-like isoform X2 [Achroia grisella]|uniref:golgin subfamily A member 5-like isoform X2 n=1 Tax=Achroia grisella TaxID=688607 RepID=UPI0027D24122|nr:golgin subfamily A member 5-like isoform X2 [Achroia grisella]
MAWFAELAGKAESLLNNLDEQTGAALRNHNNAPKHKKHEIPPEPAWAQKKRPIPRNLKKPFTGTDTRSNAVPTKKTSPMSRHESHSPIKNSQAVPRERSPKSRNSPVRKPRQFTLNHCPNTLVGDYSDDQFGLKQRRHSLPTDLELISNESLIYKMQNLEVENAMLKNELNVMNREVSELLDRLRKTEDELSKTHIKLESSELLKQRSELDKDAMNTHLDQLKQKINELTNVDIIKYKGQIQKWETEVSVLRDSNKELEDRVQQLTEKVQENQSAHIKLENELRYAQSTIGELQNDLERSTAECRRLEKDWDAYKLRVKSMLYAKDSEIKALQQGDNVAEGTKELIEQLESLKEERDELSECVLRVRGDCSEMQQQVGQLEGQLGAAGRAVAALRDALRDERAARNRADTQARALAKELKSVQIETSQTIAGLRTALRDKDTELNHLRDTTSSLQTTDTSALNVADYDTMQSSIDNDKIHYLTETLVQKQGKIDSLLADNNMLKIQLDKLQSKFKCEVSNMRVKNAHSVVNLQDNERPRNRLETTSGIGKLSLRIGLILKRNPLFRVFIIIYMIGLHFWVLTVLLTSTPEETRPSKS